MRVLPILFLAACVKTVPVEGPALKDPSVPDRPEEIQFEEVEFVVPQSSDFRHELPGGIPVYVIPGRAIPLVSIGLEFGGGEHMEPAAQYGIANLTGTMMRSGGTADMDPDALDEELAFLAADARIKVDLHRSSARMNCLTENVDTCLDLLMGMVRTPAFDADKLSLNAGNKVERMSRRNDNADNIATREWQAMLYGRDHVEARYATAAVVEGLTPEDLAAFHSSIFHPANLVVTVTGDVDIPEILEKLGAAFDGWKASETAPDPPAPIEEMTPGLYHIEKDVPQAKVRIGMRGCQRGDPDVVALVVMNQILGGGDFSARLMKRIRTEEGLSYGAYSSLQPEVYYPGEFTIEFQTQNATTAFAIQIAMHEVNRIRDEPVSEAELAGAKATMLSSLPQAFSSRDRMAEIFVTEILTDRSPSYYADLPGKIEAVTIEDVQRVAKKWLRPDEMSILTVGLWDEIARGDSEGRADMSGFFGGEPTQVPLLDPLTLEPME